MIGLLHGFGIGEAVVAGRASMLAARIHTAGLLSFEAELAMEVLVLVREWAGTDMAAPVLAAIERRGWTLSLLEIAAGVEP